MLDMTMEQHLQQAKDCAQVGDKTGAIANYRSAIELDANQPVWVYNALGHQLLDNGQINDGEQIFQLILEKYPDQPNGLAGLALTAQCQQQWELALQRWNECLEKFPQQVPLWWYIHQAKTLMVLGRFDDAETILLAASKQYPNRIECNASLAELAQSRQQWINTTTQKYIQQGNECAKVGDRIGTIANYRSAIELDVNQPAWVYGTVGHRLLDNGQINEGEQIFQLILEKYPDQPNGLAGLALTAQCQQQWELALQRWNECFEKFSHQTLSWWHICKANTLIALQHFEEAVDIFLNLIKQYPNEPGGFEGLARIAQQQQQWESALQRWDSCLANFPQYLHALEGKAQCLVKMFQYQATEKVYLAILAIAPKHLPTYVGLRTIYTELSHYDSINIQANAIQATRYSIRAIRLNPSDVKLYLNFIYDLIAINKIKVAENIANKFYANTIALNHNDANLLMAYFYFLIKKYDLAYSYINQLTNFDYFARKIKTDTMLRVGRIEEYNQELIDVALHQNNHYEFVKASSQLNELAKSLNSCNTINNNEFELYKELCKIITAHHNFPRQFIYDTQLNHHLKNIYHSIERLEFSSAISYIEANFNSIKNSLLEASADILYLKAWCYLKLNNPIMALVNLANAIAHNKTDIFLLNYYKNIMRTAYPVLHINKIVIVIVSCKKYLGRARLVKKSLETINDIYPIIVYADEAINSYKYCDDCLIIPGSDGYEGLPEKMFKTFIYLYTNTNCRGVIKIDDDVFVEQPNNFQNMVYALYEKNPDYMGYVVTFYNATYHFGRVSESKNTLPGHKFTYFCTGGEGYFLSRNCLSIIFKQGLRYPSYLDSAVYEDVMIGEILTDAGIIPVNNHLYSQGGINGDIFKGVTLANALTTSQEVSNHPQLTDAAKRIDLIKKIYETFPFITQIRSIARTDWNKLTQGIGSHVEEYGHDASLEAIHCFWEKGKLSDMAVLSLHSFIAMGHPVILYTYDNTNLFSNISGISIESADIILPKNIFYNNTDSIEVRYLSDIFRYAVLAKKGGWWVDLDVILQKPLTFAAPYIFCCQYSDDLINGNVLKVPQGSIHIKTLLHISLTKLFSGINKFGTIGPILLTDYIFSNVGKELQKYILPPVYFNAINWNEYRMLMQKSDLALQIIADERVYGIHLWNKMWSDAKLSLLDVEEGSVVHRLMN